MIERDIHSARCGDEATSRAPGYLRKSVVGKNLLKEKYCNTVILDHR